MQYEYIDITLRTHANNHSEIPLFKIIVGQWEQLLSKINYIYGSKLIAKLIPIEHIPQGVK